jgi:hypothetical protein
MIRYLFIITMLLFVGEFSNAQTFSIEAFDGTIQSIDVVPDYDNDVLKILSSKDTLYIANVIGVEEKVVILDKHFLKIVYNVTAGSDIGLEQILLLCVNNNKLCQSLHVTSLSTYDVETVYDKRADSLKLFDEHGIYELKLTLNGNSKINYKLNIGIHDEERSKRNLLTNYNYNKQVALNFDTSQNIFYSFIKNVDGYFSVYDPKMSKVNKRYITGKFPFIILGRIDYCYINGDWYEMGDNKLAKYSYR